MKLIPALIVNEGVNDHITDYVLVEITGGNPKVHGTKIEAALYDNERILTPMPAGVFDKKNYKIIRKISKKRYDAAMDKYEKSQLDAAKKTNEMAVTNDLISEIAAEVGNDQAKIAAKLAKRLGLNELSGKDIRKIELFLQGK